MRIAALLGLPLALVVCGGSRPALAEDAPKPAQPPKLEYVYLEFSALAADEAVAVGKAITGVSGVKSMEWTVAGSESKVVREVGLAADDALVAAAKKAGAKSALVEPITSTTFVFANALHCGGCVAAVNKAVRALKGVKDVSVPEDLKTVAVVYDTRAVAPKDVEAALAAIDRPASAQTPATK